MRLRLLPLAALLARAAAAQTTTVSGVVHDSIARAPLAGATVQLVSADDGTRFSATATADSSGRFAFANVPAGRFTLGFFHAVLDSLGVEPPMRSVRVDGAGAVRADLGIPSAARLRGAICGAQATSDSAGVVVGIVRDARDGMPIAGAKVTGQWLELSFTTSGLVRRAPKLDATTGESGWFALCNVPSAGTMALLASRGADSTDVIELQVPPNGFLRRGLFVGAAQRTVASDTTRRVRTGDGKLSGRVVTTIGGQPLAGAQVGIVDGPRTRANERGEWTLASAPTGTRMLDVRAVGYYPERRPIDVVADAPPLSVSLATLKSVLDTIRVTANRFNRDSDGFEQRRRSGAGRYLGPADFAKMSLNTTSDAFRNLAGVRLEWDENRIDRQLVMRGPFGDCKAAVYINGRFIDGMTASEIDTWSRPSELAGIEIYSEASVPPQFRQFAFGANADAAPCGSVVIWTR